MPIPVWHLWQHSIHELRVPAFPGIATSTLMGLPLRQSRQRLSRIKLGEWRFPRHVYKFRAVPPKGASSSRERLEQLILDNQLYGSTSDNFNDPFDTKADYRVPQHGEDLRELVYQYFLRRNAPEHMARAFSLDESLDNPEETAKRIQENHRRILQQLGICSLSGTAREPLLWAHYADEHRGVAIQFRPSMDLQTMQLCAVEYNDTYPIIDNYFDVEKRDLTSPLLRKSKSWGYEKESRIIRAGRPNQTFSVRPEAITGVFLGMRMSGDDRAYIERLVHERDKRYQVKTCIYEAGPAPGTYKVRFLRIR